MQLSPHQDDAKPRSRFDEADEWVDLQVIKGVCVRRRRRNGDSAICSVALRCHALPRQIVQAPSPVRMSHAL